MERYSLPNRGADLRVEARLGIRRCYISRESLSPDARADDADDEAD